MISLQELVQYTDALLDSHSFSDYCPNGLQVEGRQEIQKLVAGVTACQALLDAAIEESADAILVHHGYFWKGESPVISGMKKRRIKSLLDSDVSLLAYHLPLDAHPQLGNNAGLAAQLGLSIHGRFGDGDGKGIGMYGSLSDTMEPADFVRQVAKRLDNNVLHIPGKAGAIKTIAWCTGAAQGYIEQALGLGVDAYLSGEISEQTVHIARETGIHYFSAGHHATERYGPDALGRHLSEHFQLEYSFIDVENPV